MLVLASSVFRIFQIGESDMGFLTHAAWTLPTLLLHAVLNLSSLHFRLPSRRIATDRGRIWPEYRLRSLVFCLRGLACIGRDPR